MLRFFGVVAVLVLFVQPAFAQKIAVMASVSETTIGTEETAVYAIEIQGVSASDLRTPQPPETEGLVLLQSIPSTQRNISVVNGNMQQSLVFRWTYRPVREGRARIGATEVTVKDNTYRTEPITVNVVAQSQRPRRNPNPFSRQLDPAPNRQPADPAEPQAPDARDLFIRVIPSARTAYQNEQVAVEYQLFFREGIQLRQSRLTDSWDAEGFWREELDVETRPIPRTTVENGLRYHTITLKRAAVFPTHPGTLRIDPLRIESEAIIPSSTRSRDPFEQFFSSRSRFVPVELASPAISVEARPLPPNAPPSFNGAVGQFQLQTQVDRTSVDVGGAVQLKVVLSGTGNLATLEMPPFEPPSIFERYDPQVDANINRTGNRIRGTKTFTYVLVPRSNGTFTLPPLLFSFFNPQTEQYETLRAPERTIRVTGTATTPLAITSTADGLPVDDIAGPISSTGTWVSTTRPPLFRRAGVYALLALPLLVLGMLYVYRKHSTRLATDLSYARSRRAHPVARKHLKQAEALLEENKPRLFYEEVHRAVLGFIGNRLNIAEIGLTHTRLDARLAEEGISEDLRKTLRALLEECDQMRFAPLLPDRATMEAAHERTAHLIVALDEQFTRQPSETPA